MPVWRPGEAAERGARAPRREAARLAVRHGEAVPPVGSGAREGLRLEAAPRGAAGRPRVAVRPAALELAVARPSVRARLWASAFHRAPLRPGGLLAP